MAVIVKVQALWSGFQGAPGYTNWFGLSDGDSAAAAQALANRMRTFLNVFAAFIPTGATVKVQRTYQVLESVSGHVTAEASLGTDPAVVTGGSAVAYNGAGGAVVSWNTGAYNAAGHKVRGRTYLVPLSNCYDAQGTLAQTFQDATQAAATAAVGGLGNLIVYSRPRDTHDKVTGAVTGHLDGQVNTVISALVKDKAAILRSRRD